MRIVLEHAKQRPVISPGMDVLVLALTPAGILDYVPGAVTAHAQNGTFTVLRHDGRFEQGVAANRMKLERLKLGSKPAQMSIHEATLHVRANIPSLSKG